MPMHPLWTGSKQTYEQNFRVQKGEGLDASGANPQSYVALAGPPGDAKNENEASVAERLCGIFQIFVNKLQELVLLY